MAVRNRLEVTVLPQDFSKEQQEQARKNISAAAISATVSKIESSDGSVSAEAYTAADGSIHYNLKVSAEPVISDTVIYGTNGISAKNQGVNWTIGLSADYLTANALDNLSGNWQNTYNTVTDNSGKWNEVSSKLDTTAFSTVSSQFAIKTEVQKEFEQTSSWVVETFQPKGDYLSANALDDLSGNWENTYNTVSAYSGDFAYWKNEYETVTTNSGNWNDVSSKLDTDIFSAASGAFALKDEVEIELAKKQDASGMSAYATSSWVNDNYQAKGDYLTADALNGYSASWNETSATVKTNSANWDNGYEGYNWIFDNSANIVDASAALFNNSGNWQATYSAVSSNSAKWDEISTLSENVETLSGELKDTSAYLSGAVDVVSAEFEKVVYTSATTEWDVEPYTNGYGLVLNDHEFSVSSNYFALSADVDTKLEDYYKKSETSGTEELNTRFEPIETDLDILKENSAHNVVESKNDYIKVSSGTNKFELEFTSGDLLATKTWVETWVEQVLSDFGGFEPADPTGADNHPNVDNPSNKKIYLVADATAPEPDKSREWIVTGEDPTTGWYCIGDTSLDLTPYVKISDISAASATWNNAYNWVYNNSANVTEASGAIKEVSSTFTAYSGKWNDVSATLFNNSSNWNSVYDTVDSNSSKWENSYTALTSKSADWNEVSAKLDASESAKYMFLSDLKGTEDGKLSGYGSSAFYYPEIPEYSGKDGIKVEDYWITISADYLSANALDELSGNWEQSYTALTATSAKWDSVYTAVNENSASWNEASATVNTNSAKWNEASAFSANSGKFVTSALADFEPGLAHVLTKDGNDVAWSGIDLSDLGKMYPITSLTPDLVSATISAIDGTSAYVLSAASAAEIPGISGISGVSAYFDSDENKYIVGLEDYNAIGFAKFTTSANVYTGTNVFDGYSQTLNLNTEKIALNSDKIVLQPGLYHVDLQCLMEVTGNDNNYYTTVISTIPAAASITQMIDTSYAHEETIDLSFDIRITQGDTALDISVDGFQVGGTYTISNLNIHEIISMPSQIQGGANNYQAGDAIDITNDTLSVKFDSASGIGLNANGQLVVKLGTGLTFDTSGAAAGQLSIDDVTEEVVNTVQTISNDLDTKVTTNFPPAMIIKTDCDIAAYRGAGTLYGNLFNVSINSVIEIDRTMIGVYVYQVDNDKNVILGLYEYQPDYPRYNNEDPTQGISGYGRTVALCDTGVITIPQGTVGFCEYPIKNLNNTIGTPNEETRPSLKSSCMYYATIFMGSDMNSDGLKLYGVTGYVPQVNQIKPGLNICPQNYNLALNDTAYSGQISFNDFGFGWKYDNYVNHYTQGDTTTASISYQEKSDGNRFYMQIRNKPQTSNI